MPRSLLILGFVVLTLCGCDSGEKRMAMPSLDPGAAGQQALEDYDANHDGAISSDELEKSPGLKAAASKLDKDSDHRLTAEEISDRIAAYRKFGVALVTATCSVSLNGRPLPQAEVTLIPERFMGPAVKPARATTDEQGGGTFQIEGESLSGVHCGIYRVEVSKKDAASKETLPAKYNQGTTLGADIGPGGSLTESVLTLKLGN